MTFLHFLAWAFYWMRLELAVLSHPSAACSVTYSRGRWRALFGESSGEGRESWRAIRHLLEGRPETEPLELDMATLADMADQLEEAKDKDPMLRAAAREAATAELEAKRARDAAELEALRQEIARIEEIRAELTAYRNAASSEIAAGDMSEEIRLEAQRARDAAEVEALRQDEEVEEHPSAAIEHEDPVRRGF